METGEENDDMNHDETEEKRRQDLQEQIQLWFSRVQQTLVDQFEGCEVDGEIALHPKYGHLFLYRLTLGENSYECGFLLTELVRNFQLKGDPEQWLSSFFVDLIENPKRTSLPEHPQTEEEAKRIIDEKVIPDCAAAIQEEFPNQEVSIEVQPHPEHGLVLAAGFPSIEDEDHTYAMPLGYLLALYLLNRDPAEPIIQGLYRLQEEHS